MGEKNLLLPDFSGDFGGMNPMKMMQVDKLFISAEQRGRDIAPEKKYFASSIFRSSSIFLFVCPSIRNAMEEMRFS